jgi:hypothetical protein
MAKTVIGLFDTHLEAQNVVQDLVNGGFRRDQISLVARDNETSAYDERQVGDTESAAGDGAGAGAVGGTVLGGTLGLLIGTGLLVIPGVGPVLAAGPLAAAIGTTTAAVGATALGAGIGAATGGLVGGLIGAGVPDEDANYYAEGVRRGGTLVTVSAEDNMADRAYSIMQQNGAINVRERGESWRGEGWTNFDPAGEPYRRSGDTGDDWRDSSKVGTGTGAATGAAIGSAGGPVGTVIGGIAGAAVGGGLGAAGDVAGERAEDIDDETYGTQRSSVTNTGRSDYAMGQRETPMNSNRADYARGQRTFESYDNDFRTHYRDNMNMTGSTYDEFSSAYRFGYDTSADTTYAGRSWTDVEPELRRRWELDRPNTWDRFKNSVRYAWERTKNTLS